MCAPLAVIATAAAGGFTAFSQYTQGVAASKMYDYQANVARQEGEIALKTGAKQSELIQDTAKVKGKKLVTDQAEFNATQKTAAAAAGVSGVTLEDITTNTFNKEKLDEMALRYNADVSSWQTTEEAKNKNWTAQSLAEQYKFASKNAKKAGTIDAIGTLLGTAATVGNMWKPLKKK